MSQRILLYRQAESSLLFISIFMQQQTSRDAFDYLEEHQVLSSKLADRMKNMVRFRNIAIHDYQRINLAILQKVISEHLGDFEAYMEALRKWSCR